MPTIWIDGDAAPKDCKSVVFKASARRGVDVVIVANRWQQIPKSSRIRFVQVGAGMDVADDYIVAECEAGDLIITADIPLAAEVVEKGGVVIDPRGKELDASNVRQALAMRDFATELRAGGMTMGGPPAYAAKDKQRFANALDRWITKRVS
jgi:hypothetical protein